MSFCIDATLFGVATVFLLIASQQIHTIIDVLSEHRSDVSFCTLILVVAAALTPLTWLGSPKNFWYLILTFWMINLDGSD